MNFAHSNIDEDDGCEHERDVTHKSEDMFDVLQKFVKPLLIICLFNNLVHLPVKEVLYYYIISLYKIK